MTCGGRFPTVVQRKHRGHAWQVIGLGAMTLSPAISARSATANLFQSGTLQETSQATSQEPSR